MIRAVLTDIEGTTTSLDFVKEILFPYAAQRLGPFLAEHGSRPELREIRTQIEMVEGRALSLGDCTEILRQWMAEDRKVTPLKSLQGLIWEDAYLRGDLKGHIYPDAALALRQWKAEGLRLFIFSSGSVKAQQLLFSHSEEGDLSPLFSGYFDTTTGAKGDPSSYEAIARTIGFDSPEILFLSDIATELAAARMAGFKVIGLNRAGCRPTADPGPWVLDFSAIDPARLSTEWK